MPITSKLTAIADAIRRKLGTSAKMTMDEMATNIDSIPTGDGYWDDYLAGDLTQISSDATELQPYMFYNCVGGAREMTFDNLSVIPVYGFFNNWQNITPTLESATFAKLTVIGTGGMQGQTILSSFTSPRLQTVEDYAVAFMGTKLADDAAKVAFNPTTVSKIGNHSFESNHLLESFDRGVNPLDITGNAQFLNCIYLREFISTKLSYVSKEMFKGCTALQGCNATGAEYFDSYAFENTHALKRFYDVHDTCYEFGSFCFQNSGIEEISRKYFPYVETVGKGCFVNSAIASVELGSIDDEVPCTLGMHAFYSCKNLEHADIACVKILNGDDTLGMFENCFSLTELFLPYIQDVVSIDNPTLMFANCYRLTGTYEATYNPDRIKGAIYVPDELLQSYLEDAAWQQVLAMGIEITSLP